jgi:hypothetical protein
MPRRRNDTSKTSRQSQPLGRPLPAEALDGLGPASGAVPVEADWQVVSVVESVGAGSVLDLLLRREQTKVLLELAALAVELRQR